MKTDDLISLLATADPGVDTGALARRTGLALLGGALGALLLMASLYGVRPDLAQVAGTPLFWAKLALPGSLALLA
ncbi:NrsF family protein, partial [Metapseudomonas otitidis]